jgi:hypothetical protein
MITASNIVEIYSIAHDFCNDFNKIISAHQLAENNAVTRRNKPSKLNDAEVITILILFHLGGYKCLKHFYVFHVQKHMTSDFQNTVSYNRFVELQSKVVLQMVAIVQLIRKGEVTGIAFIDSTPVRVCKNKRIRKNKVFKNIAHVGKSMVGFFYGFKLHIIINDKGEIINFMLTPGNIDDREPLKNESFIKELSGKLFGDKGYISKTLFENLFLNGIQPITGLRNNMKNQLMSLSDKIMLRKRSVIETVNDELKNMCQIEHSRHRSVNNFVSNLISGLLAYSFFPKKPSIKYETVPTYGQLVCF